MPSHKRVIGWDSVPGCSSSITERRVNLFLLGTCPSRLTSTTKRSNRLVAHFQSTEYTLVGTVMALESLPTSLLICWTSPPIAGEDRSIICFSVPVHPANKPSLSRWKHASKLTLPVCFISGERDPLAYEENLAELFSQLSTPTKQLSIIPGADHGFRQPKTIKVSHEAFSVAGEALTSFLASLD